MSYGSSSEAYKLNIKMSSEIVINILFYNLYLISGFRRVSYDSGIPLTKHLVGCHSTKCLENQN